GNVAAVQATNGDTRLYSQNSNNTIQEIGVSSPFNGGGHSFGPDSLVPGAEALGGTPIAAAIVNGTGFQEIHFFFVSPTNILSEYIWADAWRGGPSCTDCITRSGFVVQPGNKVLYAVANDAAGSPATLRVGFVSAGAPGTISEADFSPTKGWQVAQLPS
ncbi:hypothetical protein B0H13DRAFT_1625594, partial [Mycena leptocephala]